MATRTSRAPKSPTILEVTEESSNDVSSTSLEDKQKEKGNEYSSLLPRGSQKRPVKQYRTIQDDNSESSGDEGSEVCSSDEVSSNSSSLVTSKMTRRELLIFSMIMISTCSSSFTVCLFPPFFPQLAESKGVSASGYGLIIGVNCLTAFLVTPFVGNHISNIGVKFAFIAGLFIGGSCCALAGLLEFINPGPYFLSIAVLIRILHAFGNAMVITSSFTYTACEFPTAMAKIFSLTRTAMNVAQLCGPWLGGMMYEIGGYYMPFLVMGLLQVLISFISIFAMPSPFKYDEEEYEEEEEGEDNGVTRKKPKKKKVSVWKMLTIPTIWFSFLSFIVATVCNGFLSVNLEPQVIRNFGLTPSNVGLLYGLRDGANSLASPIWGFLCDRKKSVKPYLVLASLLVASSFFLMKGSDVIGFHIELTIPLLILALCINGMGIAGEQVVGVVDALHEAVGAGYPDDPSTQGLVAGLWSSLSGMGRFISRAGSGYLVDNFGFSVVSAIGCSLQCLVAVSTFIYLVLFECHLQKRDTVRWDDVTVVEHGRRRDEQVLFTDSSSPAESLMTRSVYIGLPHNSSGLRIANSMPPKLLNPVLGRSRSRSIR